MDPAPVHWVCSRVVTCGHVHGVWLLLCLQSSRHTWSHVDTAPSQLLHRHTCCTWVGARSLCVVPWSHVVTCEHGSWSLCVVPWSHVLHVGGRPVAVCRPVVTRGDVEHGSWSLCTVML